MTESATDQIACVLAEIHAEAFDAPWPSSAFGALLVQPGVWIEAEADGFVLMRVALDEAEILTLAVRPAARRRGIARILVSRAVREAARRGAARLFLEVAEDNAPAIALYAGLGFALTGRRPRYYARGDAPAADALLLVLNLADPLPTG